MNSSLKILVLNSGSTSQKVALVEASRQSQSNDIATDIVWKNEQSNLKPEQSRFEAIEILISEMQRETGFASDEIAAVGHRVVHGGPDFIRAQVIDESSRTKLDELVSLAPLHNKYAVQGMNYCFENYPELTQIALFDTGFHSTLENKRKVYPLPYSWYQEHGIRKYGFHGINLSYCLIRLKQMLKEGERRDLANFDKGKIVVAHLGGGCSITAIEDGKSVDTTMGFTPLEGMIMATRSGSIDPGILGYVCDNLGYDSRTIQDILNRQSGIKGVSGLTGDMQELLLASEAGLVRAQLAVDMFVDSAVKHIGAMVASLGGINCLVFTGGIGENSPLLRSLIAERLDFLNLKIDQEANSKVEIDGEIGSNSESPSVFVIKSNEYSQIARDSYLLLTR